MVESVISLLMSEDPKNVILACEIIKSNELNATRILVELINELAYTWCMQHSGKIGGWTFGVDENQYVTTYETYADIHLHNTNANNTFTLSMLLINVEFTKKKKTNKMVFSSGSLYFCDWKSYGLCTMDIKWLINCMDKSHPVILKIFKTIENNARSLLGNTNPPKYTQAIARTEPKEYYGDRLVERDEGSVLYPSGKSLLCVWHTQEQGTGA